MKSDELKTEEIDRWEDDVLGRRGFAAHLTAYIIARSRLEAKGDFRPFTLALDAEWGMGKTFFVDHWAEDLKSSSPPFLTMKFDAWKADYTADPMVSFMADFKGFIDATVKLLGSAAAVRKRVGDLFTRAFKGARRALGPACVEGLKSGIQLTTGISVKRITEAITEGVDMPDLLTGEDLRKLGPAALDKCLDAFFAKALEDQAERQIAIGAFKQSMAGALAELSAAGKLQLPMIVFIDELDRCRPNFAISLLEGVKHLFDIPGVCFVVSTNLRQLSASVRAVYGATFDSERYLQRFFDAESGLPPVPKRSYAMLVTREYPSLTNPRFVLGLPSEWLFYPQREDQTAADTIEWVSDTLDLDLRTQRKLADMILAAAVGVPADKCVFLLWMAFLCGLRLKDPQLFELFAKSEDRNRPDSPVRLALGKLCANAALTLMPLNQKTGQRDRLTVSLLDAVWVYYEGSFKNIVSDQSVFDAPYPRNLHADVVRREMPREFTPGRHYAPSTRTYFDLVRTAGHIVSPA